MVMKNNRRRKTSLSIAWNDNKKAFDLIPHTWLIECLKFYGAEENTLSFLKNTMCNWNTILTSSGIRLIEVNIFVVAMIPMEKALQKMDAGYQLEKRGNRINHLMFMDNIKLYVKNIKEIDTLIQIVRIVSGDIRMEFGIEKCALVNIQKGKVTRAEGIKLPDGSNIKHRDETEYKYWGMMEGENIKHQEMKDTIRKEYMQRFKAILNSKLNAGNMIKAINTMAVPVIRYSAGIVEWTNCNTKNETIIHIASECPALAQNEYKKRHDSVAKAFYWNLCKKHQVPCNNKWYEHQPEGVIENDHIRILWDYGIRTDRVICANRPDVTLIYKIKKVAFIDVVVPLDYRVEEKEMEKNYKNQDLKIEISRIWDMSVEIVPIIIGTLGTIPRSLKRNLEKLEAEVALGLLQKSVILGTAHIIRKVMDS
ncbi:uncharacterized protein [Palaemon carinicauda]|uniref:uncharacterized protein n=1 Tax=Palaemon carinicauda TaxID=392227 RepID=UPI0035B57A23